MCSMVTFPTLLLHAVVAEGNYIQGPGSVAACPKGEYKSPTAAACLKCAYGVTTAGIGSSSEAACNILLPTFAPALVVDGIVKSTRLCPQKYLCPGGQATKAFDPSQPSNLNGTSMTLCADGTWTAELGASYPSECCKSKGWRLSAVQGLSMVHHLTPVLCFSQSLSGSDNMMFVGSPWYGLLSSACFQTVVQHGM